MKPLLTLRRLSLVTAALADGHVDAHESAEPMMVPVVLPAATVVLALVVVGSGADRAAG